MPKCCEECKYCKVINGSQRGVIDCDPDEYICEVNADEFEDYDFNDDVDCSSFEQVIIDIDIYNYWENKKYERKYLYE